MPRAAWPGVFIEKERDWEDLSPSPQIYFVFLSPAKGRTKIYGDLELRGAPGSLVFLTSSPLGFPGWICLGWTSKDSSEPRLPSGTSDTYREAPAVGEASKAATTPGRERGLILRADIPPTTHENTRSGSLATSYCQWEPRRQFYSSGPHCRGGAGAIRRRAGHIWHLLTTRQTGQKTIWKCWLLSCSGQPSGRRSPLVLLPATSSDGGLVRNQRILGASWVRARHTSACHCLPNI